MARRKGFRHTSLIEVHLWGQQIGAVALDTKSGFYAFRYTDDFRGKGIEPSPLQMPTSQEATWVFPTLNPASYRRLPAMINDSLPDAFGNSLIEKILDAEYSIQKSDITPLDRLAYLGNRAMGALQFKPPTAEKKAPTALDLAELVQEVRRATLKTEGIEGEPQTLHHIFMIGVSAGGARPKAVVCWNPTTDRFQSGQFDAPKGFEHWLLKFDGVEDDKLGGPRNEGRVEFAYYLMALAAGIKMTECRLHEEGGRAHFMTRRFDREGNSTRHHLQTLCAMAHMDLAYAGAHSYSQLFQAVLDLRLKESDLEQTFRRMAFNVMARNLDDHTKNFSFLLRKEGGWELAPAYDVNHAHDPGGRWNYQHFLAINGKHDGITRKDLLLEAERFSVGRAEKILEEVRGAVEQWGQWCHQAGVPQGKAEMVRADHRPV